jgi:predicted secreted protein with PEFG-CTERM motif
MNIKLSYLIIIIILFTVAIPTSLQFAAADDMKGNNISMSITSSSFNPSVDKQVTLVFTPTPTQQMLPIIEPNGKVEHLDYLIKISKDGQWIYTNQFHTHSGTLTLVFTPLQAPTYVTGGESDPNNTTTDPFNISGKIFDENGNYQISASIVGVEFNPLSTPIEDKFTMQVVPEFGSMVTLILISSIIGIIVLSKIKFMSNTFLNF